MAVSDEVLRALGRVTVNFQFLESQVAICTWTLISPDQRVGQIVTHNLSFSKLCDVFGALVQHRTTDQALIQEMSDFLRRVSELEQRRNAFMHSNWATSEGRPDAGSIRLKASMDRKKGWKLGAEDLTPAAINSVADAMGSIGNDLLSFIFKLK